MLCPPQGGWWVVTPAGPDSPEQQEAWIRHWLVTKAGVSPEDAAQVRLKWYPARYSPLLGSVFHRQVMVDLPRETHTHGAWQTPGGEISKTRKQIFLNTTL